MGGDTSSDSVIVPDEGSEPMDEDSSHDQRTKPLAFLGLLAIAFMSGSAFYNNQGLPLDDSLYPIIPDTAKELNGLLTSFEVSDLKEILKDYTKPYYFRYRSTDEFFGSSAEVGELIMNSRVGKKLLRVVKEQFGHSANFKNLGKERDDSFSGIAHIVYIPNLKYGDDPEVENTHREIRMHQDVPHSHAVIFNIALATDYTGGEFVVQEDASEGPFGAGHYPMHLARTREIVFNEPGDVAVMTSSTRHGVNAATLGPNGRREQLLLRADFDTWEEAEAKKRFRHAQKRQLKRAKRCQQKMKKKWHKKGPRSKAPHYRCGNYQRRT